MNRKLVFSLLTLATVFVASYCGPGSVVVNTPVTDQTPIAPSIPIEDKPSLVFSESAESIKVAETHQVIAYTFPKTVLEDQDSAIAIKVAPYTRIQFNPGGLTAVGVVEIGPGAEAGGPEPGIYRVEIDLDSGKGQLSPINASQTYFVDFQLIQQIVNPARTDSPYEQFRNLKPAPDTAAAINADGACFIVKMSDGIKYVRYCSQSGSVLSVRTYFASKYTAMSNAISELAKNFDIAIQVDQVISEMEHPEHLIGCSKAIAAKVDVLTQLQSCSSDIAVAPVTADYFSKQFDEAKNQSGGGSFSVPVAVAQVFQLIKISNGGSIPEGNYQMNYWYDSNGVFYAATVTPLGNKESKLGVPAVPATFINDSELPGLPEQPAAQISTCRILGFCTFFQSSCS